MKSTILIVCLLFAVSNAWFADDLPWCHEPFKYPVTMETSPSQVDIPSYMGTWYEVARMPIPSQPDCACSQAIYNYNPTGGFVKVENTCILRSGASLRIVGKAFSKNSLNTRLEVAFDFDPSRMGNYWILEIEPNYQWVVVGEPCKKDAWILSRTRTLLPTVLSGRIQTLQNIGYNVSKLVFRDPKC